MNDHGSGRAILIAGPTASGKSAVALALAKRLGGVVINADSMQVYADLRILTARPTPDEEAQAPHLLFGHVDAAEAYSVGRWLDDVGAALERTWAERRVPVIVGGTGLYFRALTRGLSAMPAVPDAVRARIRHESEGVAPETLHARLATLDPIMAARLRPSDPQRIVRAMEILEATGQSLSAFQAVREAPLLSPDRVTGVVLAPKREVLNARIEARLDDMMAAGALDEVRRLEARELDPALPCLRALGVPPLLQHVGGSQALDEAVAEAKLLTRRYAKRQATFFRHQMPDLTWCDPGAAPAIVLSRWSAQPGVRDG